VLLTELLYQRVKELGAQGAVALKPGYVAIHSRATTLRALISASLFPGPDDERLLVDGDAAARVGVGLIGKDTTPYRMLREIGGSRHLHHFDPAQKRFVSLTEDDLEIASFLRVETELPTPETFRFFLLSPRELPSQYALAAAPSADLAKADLAQAKALKAELLQTRQFEEAQDKLFKVQLRIQELGEQGSKLEAAEHAELELASQMTRALFTPSQVRDLTHRAQRAAADEKKHGEQLAELRDQQRNHAAQMPGAPDDLHRDPLLWIGLGLGFAIDALAFLFAKPVIALAGLVPFAAALVAALRWIDAREHEAQAHAHTKRLVDREAAIKKAYADEQAPLQAALQSAGVTNPDELVELFRHREEIGRLHEEAAARLAELRAQPGISELAEERSRLIEQKQIFEMTVAAQGFARPVAEVERDLRRAMGMLSDPGIAKRSSPGIDLAQAPRALLEQAAALVGGSVGDLWTQLAARLAVYLSALTDKRISALRLEPNGTLSALAPDGRAGPYASLPQSLRDLAYASLRLALLERVASVKHMPIFIDDTFLPLDPAKRGLVHKMLKSISAHTQVLHRCAEPPPAGLADLLVRIP
jgi:hypothetical protein